jgi:hypothetical protein
MKNKAAVVHYLIIGLAIILLVFPGCGKKGLPLAPQIKGQAIAAPFDLKYSPGDKESVLSWNHRVDNETASVKPKGFEIFMAKKTMEACTGCPFEFKNIGLVPMPLKEFVVQREKGFKYYFRVRATGEDNMRSEYSKTVQFDSK